MAVIEAAPILLHKNVPVAGIKVLDEEHGIVEAFVAGIGNKDSTGDIIQPGAFDDSLKIRTPKGVWSHDWSRWVSKTLDMYQVLPGDPRLPLKMSSRGVGGLYVKMQFNLETQDGKDAFSNVKFFDEEAEWSIGYMEVESEYSKDAQANLLHKIDLYEYSPVLFGANNLTSTVSVKVTKVGNVSQIQISGLNNKDLEAQVSKAVAETLADAETNEKTADEAPEGAALEEKTVPGSFEDRYGAVCEALTAEYPDAYAFAIATFSDSVVYEVMSWDDSVEGGTYQRSYSIDEAGAVTLGEPSPVDVVEVVIAKSGGIEGLEAKGGSLEKLKEAVGESQKERLDALIEKAGRVLSTKNQDRLAQAKTLIDDVLSSGDKATEETDEGEKGVTVEEPKIETDEKSLAVTVALLQEQVAKLMAGTPETKADSGAEDNDDPDEDVVSVAEALDAAIDAISEAVDDGNLEQIDALVTAAEIVSDQLLELVGGTDADDAKGLADGKTKAKDPSKDEAHDHVEGEDGKCAVCGKDESDAIHEKANDEDPDDAGAGSPKKPKKDADGKGDAIEVDVAALMADLEAEMSLSESFLPAE